MKKQKLLKSLRHRLSLLFCLMAFLAIGQSAYSATYYLRYGTNNNPDQTDQWHDWSDGANEVSGVCTWTIYPMSSGNCFIYLCSSKPETPSNAIVNLKDSYTFTDNGNLTNLIEGKSSKRDSWSSKYYLLISLKSNSAFTISWNISSHAITVGSGSPTPTTDTWKLRGEFTSWSTNEKTFEGEGNTLSCTTSITAGEYKQGQNGKGFKIVKNDDTWYGAKTTMTRENNSATFQNGNGDEWNCGLNADITGNYTFTITNLTGNPELTITYPQSTYPIARWGAAPIVDGSKNINASAYVATHGCNGSTDYEVTQLRVRYWKEGDVANAEVIETEEGTYDPGAAYTIEIPYTSNVLINCTTESKIIMEVAAKNDLGWSSYSDRMAVMYTAGTTFVTHNLEKSFTACEGNHQFTLSEMVGPVPGSWAVVTSGGADAKSEFTLADGEMIWNPGDKTTETYIYTFTFSKEGGYVDKSATLTINYTKTAPSGTIGDISASSTSVSKYTPVTLSATMGTGVTKIKWSVTPNTFITETDANHATFQGKAVTTYTVTAVGLSTSCGETASKTKQITVTKDTEECNE